MKSLIYVFVGIISLGYIYNLVWLFDHWNIIEGVEKFVNVGFVFVPPFGGILGIYHFFF